MSGFNLTANIDGSKRHLNRYPDKCPYCHNNILPNPLNGHTVKQTFEIAFTCTNNTCQKVFIGYYHVDQLGNGAFITTSSGNLLTKVFADSIINVSPNFGLLYNQSYQAEQYGLTEICGVGYRKALEFLIKDYAITKHPASEAEIKSIMLGTVINGFIEDDKIKAAASRAAWLGNDETHYVRRWESKDLQDLKRLIDLTVHSIEMDALLKEIEIEMPDGKK